MARGVAASRAGGYAATNNSALSGQRIRVTGWMKTSAVGNWAGASLSIIKATGEGGPWDRMYDRPLHVADRCTGAMSVRSYEAHHWSREDVQTLRLLATQIAPVLELRVPCHHAVAARLPRRSYRRR